jgi:hypothetical protein
MGCWSGWPGSAWSRPAGRQRTDSTHVLGAIRALNRLELAGETLQAALEALAVAAPGWLAGVIDASWQQVYGRGSTTCTCPKARPGRRELMIRYGTDGYFLLEQAHGPGAPGWLRELPGNLPARDHQQLLEPVPAAPGRGHRGDLADHRVHALPGTPAVHQRPAPAACDGSFAFREQSYQALSRQDAARWAALGRIGHDQALRACLGGGGRGVSGRSAADLRLRFAGGVLVPYPRCRWPHVGAQRRIGMRE